VAVATTDDLLERHGAYEAPASGRGKRRGKRQRLSAQEGARVVAKAKEKTTKKRFLPFHVRVEMLLEDTQHRIVEASVGRLCWTQRQCDVALNLAHEMYYADNPAQLSWIALPIEQEIVDVVRGLFDTTMREMGYLIGQRQHNLAGSRWRGNIGDPTYYDDTLREWWQRRFDSI